MRNPTQTEIDEAVRLHNKWTLNFPDGVRLDLKSCSIRDANFTGAELRCADLSGADLPGANFSCASLAWVSLRSSNLSGADFSNADLSGADFTGANLTGATCFGKPCTKPFITMTGLPYRVTILDAHIKIGCQLHTTDRWKAFADTNILTMDGQKALDFWHQWRTVILAAADAHQGKAKEAA